ncbi:hypothetical protein IM817_09580 [Serratia marcescens]|uniref:hypothetical protein n=1 Tax=Serratia marcescens TaxID=615 RepID=UPI001C59D313|nr:hypothetical protein [Serratia marcescens]QXX98406.1 hypothetical protein IM817_09580 [Serratia marcescens]
MKSGAVRHLVRRVAGCILFFGLVAPPLGGMLLLLMMTFGISGYVDPGYFNVGDVLGMLVFIGAFSYALGFLPACLVGGHRGYRSSRHSPIAVVSVVMRGSIRHCSWFAECRSAYFWYDRGFARHDRWVFMVAPEVARCLP